MPDTKCLKCLLPLSNPTAYYGLHEACFLAWFQLKMPAEFSNLARKSVSTESSDKTQNNPTISSFFHGKFRKYSAELGDFSYLLKVREPQAPELPEVEYLSNQIGEAVGIPVAKFYLIEFVGERTFVTQNFITNKFNSNLSHIYHYQQNRPRLDCESLLSIIAEKSVRHIDVEVFIHVCLFDALIGNHDRHGRNLGFIISTKGIMLAPIYDNPSALGLESGEWLKADFSPRGRIPTKVTNTPSAIDYVDEFKRLGHLAQIQSFAKKLDLNKLNHLVDQSFCSGLMKNAYKQLIQKRTQEILNGI